MVTSFRILLNTTLVAGAILCGRVCVAQDDHGIRRSGVHLSHGYPIPYNSLSFPRPYVGVPPYQIGVNTSGYGAGYTHGNRSGYGGVNAYQRRNYNNALPNRHWYLPNGNVRH